MPHHFKTFIMKRVLLLAILMGIVLPILNAQTPPPPPGDHPRMNATYIKDRGVGSRVNFGVTFAPTINWMYDHTTGYEKNGVVMGMRYGLNLNINLTHGKNFYFSTGLFAEHTGGKMKFLDNIPIGPLGIADSMLTQRTYRSIYLSIPTGITMKTNSINNFYICGNVGLMHSFNLNASNIDSYYFGEELWSRQRVSSDEAALFKESFFVGVGFEYAVTPSMRAGVMINYAQSFTNYFKGQGKARNGLSGVDQRANLGCVEIALNINFF